jgi:hypothetical protein
LFPILCISCLCAVFVCCFSFCAVSFPFLHKSTDHCHRVQNPTAVNKYHHYHQHIRSYIPEDNHAITRTEVSPRGFSYI